MLLATSLASAVYQQARQATLALVVPMFGKYIFNIYFFLEKI